MTGLLDQCMIAVLDSEAAPMTATAAKTLARVVIQTIAELPADIIAEADNAIADPVEHRADRLIWYRAVLDAITR